LFFLPFGSAGLTAEVFIFDIDCVFNKDPIITVFADPAGVVTVRTESINGFTPADLCVTVRTEDVARAMVCPATFVVADVVVYCALTVVLVSFFVVVTHMLHLVDKMELFFEEAE
jgi:hypothetical protein